MDYQNHEMEKLYTEYFPKIYNYVFYRLLQKEETEDMVSYIFLKIAEHLDSYDAQKANLNTWIYSIASHTFTDYCRTRKKSVSFDNDENDLDYTLTVDFDTQYDQILDPKRKILLTALAQMSERDSTILYCVYFEGMRYREVSERLGINESTLSSALMRAKAKLRRQLEQNGSDVLLR